MLTSISPAAHPFSIAANAQAVINSVGVYYNDDKTQKVGYYRAGERTPENFFQVCIIEINNPYQDIIVAAVKAEIISISKIK